MHQLRIHLALISIFAILVVATGGIVLRQRDASAATDLVVLAGNGEDGYAVNAYLPSTVTVARGASVTWDFAWFEPHTITFGTPPAGAPVSTPSPATYDGTGFLTSDMTFGPGKQYTVTFSETGSYPYYCLIHPFHRGTVTVVDEPSSAVDTQEAVDARGAAEYASAVGELKSIAAESSSEPIEIRSLPDGSTESIVKIPRATRYGDVQQFFPPAIAIEQGDTITWRTAANSPHTVTFGPFPTGIPLPGNPLVDEIARPGEEYTGTGYWNSGPLGIDWPVGTEFTLKFATPGTYAYYCILHIDQGHVGTVEVRARSSPSPTPTSSVQPTPAASATPTKPASQPTPRPPATGGGHGEPGGWDSTLMLSAVLLLFGLTAAAWAFHSPRRRARRV